MADEIEVEILSGGRLKITTNKISSVNHRNADELIEFVNSKLGGPVANEKKKSIRATVSRGVQRKI